MKSRASCESALDEAKLLKALRGHPCIVHFEDAFYVHEVDRICIVMERAETDLKKVLEWHLRHSVLVPVNTGFSWLLQIALGLAYLHQKNIAHRDIKPANILILADGRVVLGDFGASKGRVLDEYGAKTFLGTPFYLSPEVFEGTPEYGTKSDIWSFGCIAFEVATSGQYRAFQATTLPELEQAVANFRVQWSRLLPSNGTRESAYIEIIQATLCRHPASRVSVSDLLQFPVMKRALGGFICDITAGSSATMLSTDRLDCLFSQLVQLGLRNTLIAGIHLGLELKRQQRLGS